MWSSLSLWHVLMLAVAAIISASALSVLAMALDLPALSQGRELLTEGVLLSAVTLIPASVFTPAVGAMFPNYDRATPVTVIADETFAWLLGLVTLGLFLGGTALVFDLTPTLLLVAPIGVVVGLTLVVAVWLIGHSLAILDPDRLSAFLAHRATRHPFLGTLRPPDPNQPFKDICRLARGYLDRQRPEAAANAILRMADVWREQERRMDEPARTMAARVLGEAKATCATSDGARGLGWDDYLAAPIASFVAVSGIQPDARSEQGMRERLRWQQPWRFEERARAARAPGRTGGSRIP